MNLKKIAGTATVAGALVAAALGLGAGSAQADPHWGPNIPWIPGPGDWVDWSPFDPGQLKQWCPWHSPPGHWKGGPHGVPCSNIF
jgi:hypothetical protein